LNVSLLTKVACVVLLGIGLFCLCIWKHRMWLGFFFVLLQSCIPLAQRWSEKLTAYSYISWSPLAEG